jgi:hypothetical protein
MSRTPIKPYLINKDNEGRIRLTVRETRYNSWDYPIVTATLQEETFRTAAEARAFAREHFGAEAGQYASK